MKLNRTLLFIEGFMALVLGAYSSAFWIFPEIPSSDFGVHLALSRDIAHGILPSLSSSLLYEGVEMYLAIGQLLFPHANPFVVVRLSMALLVFLSPLVVYVCAKEVFQDSFKAKMSALVYALTGWIWVEWVLVTGLYANFYGFLASLLLVATTLRFANHRQFRYLTSGPNARRNFSYSVTKELIRSRLSRSLKVTRLRFVAVTRGLPESVGLSPLRYWALKMFGFLERNLAARSYVLNLTRASQTSSSQSEKPWTSMERPCDFLSILRDMTFLPSKENLFKPKLFGPSTVRTHQSANSDTGHWTFRGITPRFFGFLLMLLATVNAAFSHYSTLLVFPVLMGYLLYKRNFAGFAVLTWPLAVGVVINPNIVTILLNFLAPTTVIGPGSSLPAFSLSALDAELTTPEFAFLMLGALAFAYLAFKKRDSRMFLLLAWFILPLVVAPLNSSAWRFAFISLMPGTLMLGYVLSLVPKFPLASHKGVNHANFYRTVLLVGLVLSPTFYPSWGYLALTHSLQDNPQQGVYDSLIWLGSHLEPNYTVQGARGLYLVCNQSPQDPHCPHLVSVNDWRLTYSPLLGGPDVLYAPDYGVLWEDPFQTQLFALNHNSDYIAVVNGGTLALPSCDQRYSFGLTLSADTTRAKPNQTITLTIGAIRGLNASANLFDNGASAASVRIIEGSATVKASFPHAGNHSLVLAIGSTATSPLNLSIGPYAGSNPASVSVPPLFCQPFWLYNPASMAGWSVVYRSDSVVIWRYGE